MTARHTYMFDEATDEQERLRQQSTALDPLTERFLARAGLAPGMRVLDLGTGAGNVAALAADKVGPSGSVVGVDRDPNALAGARTALADRPQVEFVEADILTLDGVDGEFDAVIGRAVLLHVPEPATVLRVAAERVRPGGLLCMHEPDMTYLWTNEPTPLWADLRTWLLEVLDRVGVHTRMGPDLFTAFRSVGLPDPEVTMGAPVGGGTNTPTFGWANIFGALLPLVETLGLSDPPVGDLDTLRQRLDAEVDAADGCVMGPPMYGAWCTVPG